MNKVTFPHMGNMKIPARAFFQEMGLEVIVPPENSQKTLDLGVKHSPELACLPLKINLGNFIEALEMGAEYIVMGGGMGPCRFGYYGEVQKEILKELGYDFEMIILEHDLKLTFKRLKKLFNGFPITRIIKAGRLTWAKIKVMDEITKLVLKTRAREKEEGQANQIYEKFLSALDRTMSIDKCYQIQENYQTALKECQGEYKRGQEIKIGIVGEIYVVLENFTNLNTARKLGQLGATVIKEVSISHWLLDFLNLSKERKQIKNAGKPYINSFVGGHGQDSVGNAVKYAEMGVDGIVHISPFTCMPEIVAQSILPEVEKKEDIKILSLVFDEHTGEAGLKTRLEAFVDLLLRKKTEKNKDKEIQEVK